MLPEQTGARQLWNHISQGLGSAGVRADTAGDALPGHTDAAPCASHRDAQASHAQPAPCLHLPAKRSKARCKNSSLPCSVTAPISAGHSWAKTAPVCHPDPLSQVQERSWQTQEIQHKGTSNPENNGVCSTALQSQHHTEFRKALPKMLARISQHFLQFSAAGAGKILVRTNYLIPHSALWLKVLRPLIDYTAQNKPLKYFFVLQT